MTAFDSYEKSPPKLIAGARCLDFLNTVEWRGRPDAREERLTSYGEFAAWAKAAGVIDGRQRSHLLALAAASPRLAADVLADAVTAREALAALLGAGETKPAKAIGTINGVLAKGRFTLRLESDGADLREQWSLDFPELRRPLIQVLRESVALLSSPERARVHHCSNDQCQWFFLDTSRNRSRRWCQMESCGNNAKARAHYHRHRVES
jgi:predicted RNA-binding Zn ribbon-like protein